MHDEKIGNINVAFGIGRGTRTQNANFDFSTKEQTKIQKH